ncbi:hypothetical protein SLEP1_g39540 [Rubroshorea leprosula]|uniref:Uncharacterized protein n=1 Tax=Rubroshorea leprosula TaxID=152421 RepID=A0AAV5L1B8_9ROSI|nr:hypothetical protein SLEP1_g39540 [Rubroshorea leprosula]
MKASRTFFLPYTRTSLALPRSLHLCIPCLPRASPALHPWLLRPALLCTLPSACRAFCAQDPVPSTPRSHAIIPLLPAIMLLHPPAVAPNQPLPPAPLYCCTEPAPPALCAQSRAPASCTLQPYRKNSQHKTKLASLVIDGARLFLFYFILLFGYIYIAKSKVQGGRLLILGLVFRSSPFWFFFVDSRV